MPKAATKTMPAKRDRSHTFMLKLASDEPAMLARIAEAVSAETGLKATKTGVIRRWIRAEFARLEKNSPKSQTGG